MDIPVFPTFSGRGHMIQDMLQVLYAVKVMDFRILVP